MKRLIFLMLALLVAVSASAATKVQVMTDGVIDVDRLPTISFFQETDPSSPALGQVWWNNATNQLKVAGALGVYAFNSTSLVEWDTTPEAFSFTDVANATTNSTYVSDPITVSGINWPAAISVSGAASAKYSINNADATSISSTVTSGDSVRAVVTSSASDGTAVNATVTIGGLSDVYSVTTAAAEVAGVSDSFDTDSRSNYSGTVYTSGASTTLDWGESESAVRSNAGAYANAAFRHTTQIGTDQVVTARFRDNGAQGSGALLLGADGASGYIAVFMVSSNRVYLYELVAGTSAWSGGSSLLFNAAVQGTWASGTQRNVKCTLISGVVTAYIDWNDDGDFNDSYENIGSFTQDTTLTGQYAGIGFRLNGSSTTWAYSFTAEAYE